MWAEVAAGDGGGALEPKRVSERDRARAAAVLRRRYRQGSISPDTFAQRLDAVLAARYRRDLSTLVGDLPTSRLRRARTAVAGAFRRVAAEVRAVLFRPSPTRLLLPLPDAPPVMIGRSRQCDLVVPDDPMVSGRHAELHWEAGGWVLTDQHSTNGTWLNGARLLGAAVVRPGDQLRIGETLFVLAGDAPSVAGAQFPGPVAKVEGPSAPDDDPGGSSGHRDHGTGLSRDARETP
jgi:hypothetical protein